MAGQKKRRLIRALAVRRKYLLRIISMLVLCLFLPMMGLSFVISIRAYHQIQKSIAISAQRIAGSLAANMDEYTDVLDNLAGRLSLSPSSYEDYLYGDWTGKHMDELQALLNSILQTQPLLEDVALCFPLSDRVITRTSTYIMNTFRQNFFPELAHRQLQASLMENDTPFYLFPDIYAEDGRIIYCVRTNIRSSSAPRVLMFLMSQSSVQRAMRSLLPANYYLGAIYAPDRTLLYHDIEAPFHIADMQDGSYTGEDGETYLTFHAESEEGYTVVVYSLRTRHLEYASYFTRAVTVFCVFAGLLMLAGLLLVAYFTYRPLNQLLSDNGIRPQEHDEFGALKQFITQQGDYTASLTTELNKQNEAAVVNAYEKLLFGIALSPSQLAKLPIRDHYFILVVPLSQKKLLTSSPGLPWDSRTILVESIHADQLVCIISAADEEARKRIVEAVESALLPGVAVGFSDLQADLSTMNGAYQAATPQVAGDMPEKDEEGLCDRLLSYIDANLSDPYLGIPTLTVTFKLSSYALTKMLKARTGQSFKKYLTGRRIALSKEYLENTDMQIQQISERCGFVNASYFIKVFRESEGVTPTKFRGRSRDEQPQDRE